MNNGGILGSQRGESLDATSLLWNGGGTLNYQLGGASDSLNLSGALTKGTGSAFVFSFANNGIGSGEVFNLVTFSTLSGFTASDFSYTGSGVTGTFLLDANRLQFVAAVVPESSTLGLAILGAVFIPFALRQAARRQLN
ncbi:MAG: hypothetical protein EOP06_24085 [Proteobacteria bacterium]|nr:MAG: hypothetical protein EOP06_24085 [Pseudomonadota bacterium]